MVKLDKAKLFAAAKSADVARVSTCGSGKYSMSVVNSTGNGKRIALSKALVDKLQLDGAVSMLPIRAESVIMLGKTLPFEKASSIELNSADKRIAYHAGAVKLIVDTFGLDYSTKTSMSFSNVEFLEDDGEVIAVVTIPSNLVDAAPTGKGKSA